MGTRFFAMVVFFVVTSSMYAEPAFAGLSTQIANVVFETFWGRVILGILVVVVLAFQTYVILSEKLAGRRTRKDLAFISKYNSKFDWLNFQERAKDCFFRFHSSWESDDLSDANNWMTDWYWQNQKLKNLDRWRKEGLQHICHVKKIIRIKPILFVHRNRMKEQEGSVIVISIKAKIQDYLQNRETKIIIDGDKRYRKVEAVWSFTMDNGEWKVSNTEDESMSLDYATLAKNLPNIESTLIPDLRA